VETEIEICVRYEAEMAAIAALDQPYYLNTKTTPADRVNYFRRQDDLKQVRARLYAELSTVRHSEMAKEGSFRVRINDPSIGHPVMSVPQYALVHDLTNYLSVVIGHCELLRDSVPKDAEAAKHLSVILDSAHKMAKRIHESARKGENTWPPSDG
jgi:hypothetical protein